MSFVFIHSFQNQLYHLLIQNPEIKKLINSIYIGVVQDGKKPFLLIKINNAEDLSRHNEPIYSVEFQILAYAHDNNHKLLVKLADLVVSTLDVANSNFAEYSIAAIKAKNLQFEKAKDLATNKLSINYKVLIKKGAQG